VEKLKMPDDLFCFGVDQRVMPNGQFFEVAVAMVLIIERTRSFSSP
jgi:hypothetical protein